jgi:hypothetical protein
VRGGDVGRESCGFASDEMLVVYDKCKNVFMVFRRERVL